MSRLLAPVVLLIGVAAPAHADVPPPVPADGPTLAVVVAFVLAVAVGFIAWRRRSRRRAAGGAPASESDR